MKRISFLRKGPLYKVVQADFELMASLLSHCLSLLFRCSDKMLMVWESKEFTWLPGYSLLSKEVKAGTEAEAMENFSLPCPPLTCSATLPIHAGLTRPGDDTAHVTCPSTS